MQNTTFMQRVNVALIYCFPAILACGLLVKLYQGRVEGLSNVIKVSVECDEQLGADSAKRCELIQDINCLDLSLNKTDSQICQYRQRIANEIGYRLTYREKNSEADKASDDSSSANLQIAKPEQDNNEAARQVQTDGSTSVDMNGAANDTLAFVNALGKDVDHTMTNILVYNSLAVVAMVLLPFFLTGDLLGKSRRINLNFQQRKSRANENWWLKFMLALIMAVGWTYIINPLGRGASTYFQFFIAAGLESEKTLPIYVQSEGMVPVIAGFFGWYLHLIGYFFNKLIHHDVTSSRVYNLLFKKFIITYGIALIVPSTGLIEDPNTASFFMFLFGLFPLSAMSILLESVAKFTSSGQKDSGTLSQLPGISRWQILRLEEEGIDSMASLANVSDRTVKENLQVIEKLTEFWADIARLYTVVGHDAYLKVKSLCLTASEFVHKSSDQEFQETIKNLDGIGDASEIARLITTTFGKTLSLNKAEDTSAVVAS